MVRFSNLGSGLTWRSSGTSGSLRAAEVVSGFAASVPIEDIHILDGQLMGCSFSRRCFRRLRSLNCSHMFRRACGSLVRPSRLAAASGHVARN